MNNRILSPNGSNNKTILDSVHVERDNEGRPDYTYLLKQRPLSPSETSLIQNTVQKNDQVDLARGLSIQLKVLRFINKLRTMSNQQNIFAQRTETLAMINDYSMDSQCYRKNRSAIQNMIKSSHDKYTLSYQQIRKIYKHLKSYFNRLKIQFYSLSTVEPDSFLMRHFNYLMIVATVANLFYVTFQSCFYSAIDNRFYNLVNGYILLPIHTVFLTDLVLRSNTGFFQDGQMICDRSVVTSRFLKTFRKDVITILPWMISIWFEKNRWLIYFQLIFMLRIPNLTDLVETLSSNHDIDSFYQYMWQLLKLTFLTVYGSHLIACMWYLLGVTYSPDSSWVQKYIPQDGYLVEKYTISLYWSVTTMLTVGYGDILPVNDLERIFTILTMLIGCCVFGYVMSAIGMIFSQINNQKSELKKEMKKINIFLKNKNINENLKNKIRAYLHNHLIKQDMKHLIYTSQYMVLLPLQLKCQVVQQLFEPFQLQLKLVQRFQNKVWEGFLPYFQKQDLMPDDTLDHQNAWYFLLNGEIEWRHSRERTFVELYKKGDQFGQQNLFSSPSVQMGLYISKTFASVLYIEKETFVEYLRQQSAKDFQIFCQIQDTLTFYQNYNIVDISCNICFQFCHTPFTCPKTHFNFRREKLYRQNKLKNPRSYFSRSVYNDWKTLSHIQELQSFAVVFLEDMESDPQFQTQVMFLDSKMESTIFYKSVVDLQEQSTFQKQQSRSSSCDSSLDSADDNFIFVPLPQNQKFIDQKNARTSLFNATKKHKKSVAFSEEKLEIKRSATLKFAHPEVVEEVRRRRSKKNLTIKKSTYNMIDSLKQEPFMPLPDFDRGADFENYFPQYNISNVAPTRKKSNKHRMGIISSEKLVKTSILNAIDDKVVSQISKFAIYHSSI